MPLPHWGHSIEFPVPKTKMSAEPGKPEILMQNRFLEPAPGP